jgi:urease accessory protein
MLHVNKLLPAGRGLAPALLKRAATVVLDWDTRQKSRFDTEDSQGRTLGVFLPRGSTVRGGDVLVAEDGSLIKVIAQPQAVLRISAGGAHGSPFDLVRAAYHLGNRHVAIELTPEHLQIEPDHVLAAMLKKMHLEVTEQLAPFEPEAGAYAGGGHDHARGHGHAHEAPAAAAPHVHVHGPDCGHDHAHDHGHKH